MVSGKPGSKGSNNVVGFFSLRTFRIVFESNFSWAGSLLVEVWLLATSGLQSVSSKTLERTSMAIENSLRNSSALL
jgi:hypothetical protein